MGWIEAVIVGILRGLLPWLFSGSETHSVSKATGLKDLDSSALAGNGDLTLKDLPALFLVLGVLLLPGCALGGAKVQYEIVMCEPGSVVEIATDEKIPVIVKKDDKTTVTSKKNCAGMVATPKSVYMVLREAYLKQHPEAEAEKK